MDFRKERTEPSLNENELNIRNLSRDEIKDLKDRKYSRIINRLKEMTDVDERNRYITEILESLDSAAEAIVDSPTVNELNSQILLVNIDELIAELRVLKGELVKIKPFEDK